MNQNEVTGGMLCTVCRKQKNTLRPRKSKLVEGVQLYLCDACFTGRKEPRWAIVLVARQEGGIDIVSDWIKHGRYDGDPILLDELVD